MTPMPSWNDALPRSERALASISMDPSMSLESVPEEPGAAFVNTSVQLIDSYVNDRPQANPHFAGNVGTLRSLPDTRVLYAQEICIATQLDEPGRGTLQAGGRGSSPTVSTETIVSTAAPRHPVKPRYMGDTLAPVA